VNSPISCPGRPERRDNILADYDAAIGDDRPVSYSNSKAIARKDLTWLPSGTILKGGFPDVIKLRHSCAMIRPAELNVHVNGKRWRRLRVHPHSPVHRKGGRKNGR
jgi:hypothetical protein